MLTAMGIADEIERRDEDGRRREAEDVARRAVLGTESAALVAEFLRLAAERHVQPSPLYLVATYYRPSRFDFKDDVRRRQRHGEAWLLCEYRASSHGEGGSQGLCIFTDGTVGVGELSHPRTYPRFAGEIWARNGVYRYPAEQYEHPEGLRQLGATYLQARSNR